MPSDLDAIDNVKCPNCAQRSGNYEVFRCGRMLLAACRNCHGLLWIPQEDEPPQPRRRKATTKKGRRR